MNAAFWLALVFYLIAAGWTLFRAWPTMKRMLALTEQAAAAAERSALLFADILKELRRVDLQRVEKLLEAAEKWTKPKPPGLWRGGDGNLDLPPPPPLNPEP